MNKEHKAMRLDNLIDCTCYSTLDTLLRVTACVLLFVARLKRCKSLRSDDEPLIDAGDIKRAEAAWIISVQQSCFNQEI